VGLGGQYQSEHDEIHVCSSTVSSSNVVVVVVPGQGPIGGHNPGCD